MSALYFYDDAAARAFEPFALTRPACELRAGALLIRERWELALGRRVVGFLSAPHLADFDEPGAPSAAHGDLPAGSVVAHARCAVALAPVSPADVWAVDGRVAAVTLRAAVPSADLASGTVDLDRLAKGAERRLDVGGRWLDHIWDFIAQLQDMLVEDVPVLAAKSGAREAGTKGVFTEERATVEPHVHFDTSAGPVLVRRGATVQAFTRVVGPCVIGPDSIVGTDRIAGSSIGEACRVHGELVASILLGHANKSHDGFIGHSMLGRWVNLGAGTTNSNLKNTYGRVSLWTPRGEVATGMQFLGTLLGDHAKTGIGTQLTTGTVIGTGANVFGGGMPPKAVPPFAWGEGPPYETYRIEKFLDVARRVMERRQVTLSDRQARQLRAAHKARWKVARRRPRR